MAADEAIVLAGGLGKRLRSEVSDLPKPLAPVAGRPFLAWLLDRLAAGGMRRCILATGYLADSIETVVGNDWRGMQVTYSREAQPLGTGGAIRLALGEVQGEGVHVLNGDTWLEYAPHALASTTLAHAAAIGVALARVDDVARYGAVDVSGPRVTGFREKGGSGPGWINAGCYFLTAEASAALPAKPAFSFESDVLVPMAEAGRVVASTDTRGFIDIGVPDDFRRAQHLFEAAR